MSNIGLHFNGTNSYCKIPTSTISSANSWKATITVSSTDTTKSGNQIYNQPCIFGFDSGGYKSRDFHVDMNQGNLFIFSGLSGSNSASQLEFGTLTTKSGDFGWNTGKTIADGLTHVIEIEVSYTTKTITVTLDDVYLGYLNIVNTINSSYLYLGSSQTGEKVYANFNLYDFELEINGSLSVSYQPSATSITTSTLADSSGNNNDGELYGTFTIEGNASVTPSLFVTTTSKIVEVTPKIFVTTVPFQANVTNHFDTRRKTSSSNTISVDTSRRITNTITANISVDTKRKVYNNETIFADTSREIINSIVSVSISVDTNRKVTCEDSISVDTSREIINSTLPTTISVDTKRKISLSTTVNADTSRKIVIGDNISVDTIRKVSNTDFVSVDTSREVLNSIFPVNISVDTERKLSNVEGISVDTSRSVRNIDTISVDTSREVALFARLSLSTKRTLINHEIIAGLGENVLTLKPIIMLDSATDIDAITNFDFNGGVNTQGTYQIPVGHRIYNENNLLAYVTADIDAEAYNINQRFDWIADFDSINDLDGDNLGAMVQVIPYVRFSDDNSTYGDWNRLIEGAQYKARYYDFKLVLSTINPNATVVVKKFRYTVYT